MVALEKRNTFILFYDERAYCAFFRAFFSEKFRKRRNRHLKEVLIIAKGEVDFDSLTEEQERELMHCLLKCFVKLHEEEKEGGEE